jgi:proteic killer suppression protein
LGGTIVMTEVVISKFAEKQLRKIPRHIQESLRGWTETVERIGIRETRRLPGYHDEPLHGDRKGQRSIRLSRAYRAIYIETAEGVRLLVIEVNKHEY